MVFPSIPLHPKKNPKHKQYCTVARESLGVYEASLAHALFYYLIDSETYEAYDHY